jgi:hypothetical protein
MQGKILYTGAFELFFSERNRRVLKLDNDLYSWTKEGNIEYLNYTEGTSYKSGDKNFILAQRGSFFIAVVDDDPDYPGMQHLFLENESLYEEYILAEGLPHQMDTMKEIAWTGNIIPAELIGGYESISAGMPFYHKKG